VVVVRFDAEQHGLVAGSSSGAQQVRSTAAGAGAREGRTGRQAGWLAAARTFSSWRMTVRWWVLSVAPGTLSPPSILTATASHEMVGKQAGC
jgi:hypothetical protein